MPRKPLFERLPEIYRIRDSEVARAPRLPADDLGAKGPLQAHCEILDLVFDGVHDSIEDLFHDLFIETSSDWVVAYIADLLGTSHLSGDPWTLRADVARTVKHRRRKGTLGAIESLTFALSGWAVNAVEMRERMMWNQHLNHQRPDEGGIPPFSVLTSIVDPVWGGTVNLRSPAILSFLDGPFDSFARIADVKPPAGDAVRVNLPNLGIFLWRLQDYRLRVTKPVFVSVNAIPPVAGAAAFAARFVLDPNGHPAVLFNTHRYHADDEPPNLTEQDAVPGPMPTARLTSNAPAGNPGAYVRAATYSPVNPPTRSAVGLTLHIPEAQFPLVAWTFRGANLCAWETGLLPPLRPNEIAIDPVRGRVVFGVATAADGNALGAGLLASPTYGFAGPTGANPIGRPPLPSQWNGQVPVIRTVNFHTNANGLRDALANTGTLAAPLIIEIQDSMTHELDPSTVTGIGSDGGQPTFFLSESVWIRAATNQRPVIRLASALRFRPVTPGAASVADLDVMLEGLYITRDAGFGAASALVEQAAVNRLTLDGVTLDPGGQKRLDGTPQGAREPIGKAMLLDNDNGFSNAADATAFDQTPEIVVLRSITGPLAIDSGYTCTITGSIVDAGSGLDDFPGALALGAATGNAEIEWGPPLTVDGMTAFGRMRVEEVTGQGGIWVHRLEAHNNQKGCLRFSYVSGDGDRLPPNTGLVRGPDAELRFASEMFGEPGYAQLSRASDRRVIEEGPGRDEMGAFGYLLNTHKWKNINIRYREFLPVGIRAVLVPVT